MGWFDRCTWRALGFIRSDYCSTRYPHDKFDRIWTPYTDKYYPPEYKNISTKEPILTGKSSFNRPPTVVMQTAWVVHSNETIYLPRDIPDGYKFVVLYFAEIEMVNVSKPRSFSILIDGETSSTTVTLDQSFSVEEFSSPVSSDVKNFGLRMDPNSTLPPIINAYECYSLVGTALATFPPEIDALDAIKRRFGIKDWISDPCFLIPWKGIGCDNTSALTRISKIDLSGRNLTGPVPNDIGQLSELVSLYLQNNQFNGTLHWLSNLTNLIELNIENNNFSGTIPQDLLNECSLHLMSSGNPYLLMNKTGCTLQYSTRNSEMKLVLEIPLTGIVIIYLVVSSVVKIRRKIEEYSMVVVPNPTKSRAFTRDEIIAATKTFSQKIGQGGFGPVYFGKLPEGKVIAVKVLSYVTGQGIREFLNEVDLLSKLSHRNLVSLLGYCNQTKEVMLIYEHMSRGSLKDHLYGASKENCVLHWKRRLKIAIDAAQGLEYLHVGCTQKIIHRDIKPANILLDNNFNGKLADFGLSKMTIDWEATHVTTAVKGTLGYMDPEYYNTGMLTEKSDVYSFGVVLLEILCGRAAIDNELPEDDINIIRWVTPYLIEMDENGGKIIEIVDKRLCGGYELKSMTSVAKLAMRCVQAAPSSRPTVSDIVAKLRHAINQEDKDSNSILEESRDLVASSKRKGMEWSENSSNIPNEGR